MTDAPLPKSKLSAEQAFHRAATTLPLDDVKAGMKACIMLGQLARGCIAARDKHEVFTPESLIGWLRANDFHVEGL